MHSIWELNDFDRPVENGFASDQIDYIANLLNLMNVQKLIHHVSFIQLVCFSLVWRHEIKSHLFLPSPFFLTSIFKTFLMLSVVAVVPLFSGFDSIFPLISCVIIIYF